MEVMEDKDLPKEERLRKVVMDSTVRIVFRNEDGSGEETVTAHRDVFSVMDAITARLAATKSKEEMEAIRVSVHSFENEEKSEPPKEGDKRWEGPYLVGGVEIEGMTIPDAMGALAKLVVPGDHAVAAVEQLLSQLFLRSRMDGAVVVYTFDGVPAYSPLINTLKGQRKEAIVALYRTAVKVAASLRKSAVEQFPGLGLKDSDFDSDPDVNPERDAEERAKRLVLPSGLPAGMAQKGVVTPEEARRDQVRVVHLM